MAKESKKLEEVVIGDIYMVQKTVAEKRETASAWQLIFDDGTWVAFSKDEDPAIEIGL